MVEREWVFLGKEFLGKQIAAVKDGFCSILVYEGNAKIL